MLPSDSNTAVAQASLLPSFAAAHAEAAGQPIGPAMTAAEDYAFGAYIGDLLRGPSDDGAVARLVERLSALTGLDPAFLRERRGRLDADGFLREQHRAQGLIGSPYDANVTAFLPQAGRFGRDTPEAVLEGSLAPLTGAITRYLVGELGYDSKGRYEVLNHEVSRRWRWGGGRRAPQAVSDLRAALALDPRLRVLVAHGTSDLVTPYAASKVIIAGIGTMGDPGRLALATYAGGHMFYTRDASRAALTADVRRMYAAALAE
jgi:carboxypeptidase C (cathepsin A)